MLRPLLSLSLPTLMMVALGLHFASCTTDSETPNAGYGPGVTPGTENNRCRSDNSCLDEDALVCIVQNDGDQATCRARCTVADADCNGGFACVRLQNSQTEGACIPIGGLGDPCGVCDADLTCVGGVCLQDCEVVDGGSNCPAGENCASVDGGPEVCTN